MSIIDLAKSLVSDPHVVHGSMKDVHAAAVAQDMATDRSLLKERFPQATEYGTGPTAIGRMNAEVIAQMVPHGVLSVMQPKEDRSAGMVAAALYTRTDRELASVLRYVPGIERTPPPVEASKRAEWIRDLVKEPISRGILSPDKIVAAVGDKPYDAAAWRNERDVKRLEAKFATLVPEEAAARYRLGASEGGRLVEAVRTDAWARDILISRGATVESSSYDRARMAWSSERVSGLSFDAMPERREGLGTPFGNESRLLAKAHGSSRKDAVIVSEAGLAHDRSDHARHGHRDPRLENLGDQVASMVIGARFDPSKSIIGDVRQSIDMARRRGNFAKGRPVDEMPMPMDAGRGAGR